MVYWGKIRVDKPKKGKHNDYLISLLVNFSCEMGQIMNMYDFLEARWVILSNVRTDSNFT